MIKLMILVVLLSALAVTIVHAQSSNRGIDVQQCIVVQSSDSPAAVKATVVPLYSEFMHAVATAYPTARFGPRFADRAISVSYGSDC